MKNNARKKAEALQLQIEVATDEEWASVAARPGLMGEAGIVALELSTS